MDNNFIYGIAKLEVGSVGANNAITYAEIGYIEKGSFQWGGSAPESVDVEAEQVPFKPMPASLLQLSASSKAITAGAASTAAKASAAIIIRNVTIGIVTAGVIGGTGYFGYRALVKTKDKTPESSISVEASGE